MVGSSRPEAVLKDIPRAQVLRDPMEVVVRPELDLIVIASPRDMHVPLTAAALQAGRENLGTFTSFSCIRVSETKWSSLGCSDDATQGSFGDGLFW